MTEITGAPHHRIHYAIGSNGMVLAFLDRDLLPGNPPKLRPDHPYAQGSVSWDFGPLHDPIRPPRPEPEEKPAEFTDEQIDAAVLKFYHGNHQGNAEQARERMRSALRAAGARPS